MGLCILDYAPESLDDIVNVNSQSSTIARLDTADGGGIAIANHDPARLLQFRPRQARMRVWAPAHLFMESQIWTPILVSVMDMELAKGRAVGIL